MLEPLELLLLAALFFMAVGGGGLYLLYSFRMMPSASRLIPLDIHRFHRSMLLGYLTLAVNLATLVLSVGCTIYFRDLIPLIYAILPTIVVICIPFIDIPRLKRLCDGVAEFAE